MSNYAISLKRTSILLAALAFTAVMFAANFAAIFSARAGAEQLTSRSLTLSSSLPGSSAVGDPDTETNGSDATHTVTFNIATTASLGGIQLLYCQAAIGGAGGCDAPTGLNLGAATLGTTTGLSGWAKDSSTANQFRLDIGTPQAKSATNTVTINIADVVNPTVVGTFFVRVTTYTDNTFGTGVDEGTVASSITQGISITTRVAETLGFSTTGSFAGVGNPGSSCAPLTGSGAITLGDPIEQTLALDTAYDNYSAFRLYTNAANGVVVQYEGDTLRRSPTTDINPIGGTPATSIVGSEQFGLAIDTISGGNGAGTTPVEVESDAADLEFQYVDNSTNFALDGPLLVDADYAGGSGDIQTPDALFAYETNPVPASRVPATIATTTGYTNCKTVPVRYVANISPLTTSGTYTTTIVYSAVPTY